MLKKIHYLITYFFQIKFSKQVFSDGLVIIGKNVKLITEKNATITFGKNVIVKDNTTIYAKKNANIIMGNNTSTGHHTEISANQLITIGDDVIMGAHTYITDSNHGYSLKGIPFRKQPMEVDKVLIGNNVWLGRNVMLLKGSDLSNDTIVAAGAVVTKRFSGNVILGGVPAKVIKSIYE